MSKYYVAGGISCLSGLVLMLYQAVSSLTTVGEFVWKPVTIMNIIDEKYLQWADNISTDSISNILKYVLTMPLAYLILGMGVLLFIIGGITDK